MFSRKKRRNSSLKIKIKKKFVIYSLLSFVFLIGLLVTISWNRFFLDNHKLVPKSGGIYTESVIGEIKNFSPLTNRNISIFDLDIRQLIYSGLLRHNPTTGGIEGALADLRISKNGKTYFLTLKDSAKFSNGDQVSVEDVIFTYESIIQNPSFDNKSLKEAFEYITIDVVDKKTISFNLTEPNNYFSSLLTTPILRKKSYQNILIEEINDPNLPANKKPISTGPYVLKNIIPSSSGITRVFLERNNYYFAGKPYIKQIVFYVYPNYKILSENTEKSPTISYFGISTYEIEDFQKKLNDEFYLREYVLPRFLGIFFNLDKNIISNPYLRKSLSMAIDKNHILNKEKGWNRIDSIFFFEGVEGWQETDYKSARKILRDKGFPYSKIKELRYYQKEPVKLKMITSTSPAIYSRLAQNIARNWENELDIEVNVEVLNPEKFQEALQNRQYDIVFFGQNFSENPDSLSTWHSSQSGKLNLSNLTNPDIDYLIGEVRFSGDLSDLYSLSLKLEQINPAVMLATPKYYFLTKKSLLGFSKTFGKIRKHAERFAGIKDWHFEQKKIWDLQSNRSKIAEYFSWLFNDKKRESEFNYREKLPPDILEETNNEEVE